MANSDRRTRNRPLAGPGQSHARAVLADSHAAHGAIHGVVLVGPGPAVPGPGRSSAGLEECDLDFSAGPRLARDPPRGWVRLPIRRLCGLSRLRVTGRERIELRLIRSAWPDSESGQPETGRGLRVRVRVRDRASLRLPRHIMAS
jgi:hypothetical protein